jgi:flagellar hook assembly protein FlgD
VRAGRVQLQVLDVAGRVVRTLLQGPYAPGRYSVAWDGVGVRRRVPAGLYFVRLIAADRTTVRRVAIAR